MKKTVGGVLGNTVIITEGKQKTNTPKIVKSFNEAIDDIINAYNGENVQLSHQHPQWKEAVKILKRAKKEINLLKKLKDQDDMLMVTGPIF